MFPVFNVGDYFYVIFGIARKCKDWVRIPREPYHFKICSITYNKRGDIIYGTKHGHFHESVVGYQVFRTREEASEGLKALYAYPSEYSYIQHLVDDCGCHIPL